MATKQPDKIYSFNMGNEIRDIAFITSEHVTEGIDSDVYSFLDNSTQILTITKVKKGSKTPLEKITTGSKIVEGFIKGKGTLTVHLESGTQNTYYFETAGFNKPVDVKIGQSVQWTAPLDADLVYYKIRDIPQQPKPAPDMSPIPAPLKHNLHPVKLFLTSSTINNEQWAELKKLINRPRGTVNVALIENAADVVQDAPAWVPKYRQQLQSQGFNIEIIDLRKYPNDHVELLQILKEKHVIWLGDGNVFYLHWLLLSTRASEIVKYLVSKGVVYGGCGSGSILAGPTLKEFESIVDPNVVPEIGVEGLQFTESIVIPHFNSPDFEKGARTINKKLKNRGYKTVPLNDDQVLLVDGDTERVI
jgi:dipeptidase E